MVPLNASVITNSSFAFTGAISHAFDPGPSSKRIFPVEFARSDFSTSAGICDPEMVAVVPIVLFPPTTVNYSVIGALEPMLPFVEPRL